jgi:hypothetical protein
MRNIKHGFHCNAVQLSTLVPFWFVHCTFPHEVHHFRSKIPQFCCNAPASFATHAASSIYTFVNLIHFKLTLIENTVICISVCVCVWATLSGVQQTFIIDIGRVKISSTKLSPCHTTTTQVGMMKKRFLETESFWRDSSHPNVTFSNVPQKTSNLTHRDTSWGQAPKQSWILHNNFCRE